MITAETGQKDTVSLHTLQNNSDIILVRSGEDEFSYLRKSGQKGQWRKLSSKSQHIHPYSYHFFPNYVLGPLLPSELYFISFIAKMCSYL